MHVCIYIYRYTYIQKRCACIHTVFTVHGLSLVALSTPKQKDLPGRLMVGHFLDEFLRAHVRGPVNMSFGFGRTQTQFLEALWAFGGMSFCMYVGIFWGFFSVVTSRFGHYPEIL